MRPISVRRQRQRVAICRCYSNAPQCILLDEPTAMLDPKGRAEVMKTIKMLNRENGVTIVLITHYMEEAAQADRVVVIDSGEIVMDNEPKKIFSQVDIMRNLGLDVPQVTQLANGLKKAGHSISAEILQRMSVLKLWPKYYQIKQSKCLFCILYKILMRFLCFLTGYCFCSIIPVINL